MSSFNEVVKYLRLTKVEPASQQQMRDAQTLNGSSNPDKYFTIELARKIDYVPTSIKLQPYVPSLASKDHVKLPGRLAGQFNYTAPNDFFILNAPIENRRQAGILTVKWRIGTTVSRYAIYGCQREKHGWGNITHFEWYNNQAVKANCVFEYWYVNDQFVLDDPEFGLPLGYTINTSILTLPTSANDVGAALATNNALEVPGLGNLLPENLPITQDNLVYLSN